MMDISKEIKQEAFKSEFSKAVINTIYTNAWLHQRQFDLFRSCDLTTPQFNILRILRGQYPNPSTVNLLIERMLDKSSNASRIVDKLEQKGLVVRKQCAGDRRAVDVFISTKGLSVLEEMDEKMAKWEADHNNLTEKEAATLNKLLDKMRG